MVKRGNKKINKIKNRASKLLRENCLKQKGDFHL